MQHMHKHAFAGRNTQHQTKLIFLQEYKGSIFKKNKDVIRWSTG